MSLIKCKECGREISNEVKQCPGCGSTKHRGFLKKHPILSFLGVMGLLGMVLTSGGRPTGNTVLEKTITKDEPTTIKNDGMDIKIAISNIDFQYKLTKGGFDNIMLIDITAENNNPYPVKDLTISCDMTAQSGTHVGSVEKKLLKKIEPGEKLVENHFNMGFINRQVEGASCYISRLHTDKRDNALNLN